jgi:hypothetical protein
MCYEGYPGFLRALDHHRRQLDSASSHDRYVCLDPWPIHAFTNNVTYASQHPIDTSRNLLEDNKRSFLVRSLSMEIPPGGSTCPCPLITSNSKSQRSVRATAWQAEARNEVFTSSGCIVSTEPIEPSFIRCPAGKLEELCLVVG